MSRTAFVYVHGFMGSPRQFDRLRTVLNVPQQDEYALTLPGHGGAVSDFIRSGEADWQTCVDKTLDDLRQRYDRLVLVGHSMGGPLLIRSALRDSSKIVSITAISLPLRIGLTFRALRFRLASLRPPRPDENVVTAAVRDLCGVSGIRIGNAWRLLPNTIALLRIVARTRRTLPSLTIPLTAVISQNDEIVSPKSARVAKAALPSTTVLLLHKSTHFWFPEEELEEIARSIP